MSDRFRVSGLLARQLEEQNLSLAAVLRRSGLPAGFFQQERIFVTTEELFSLWRAVGDISGDPAIGLKLGTESRVERYDPAAIAALHSQSFLDAVQRMARYKQLTCPEQIRITPGNGESAVEFAFLLARDAEPAVLVDLCLSWILTIGRSGTGYPIIPLRLELTRAAAHRDTLEEHYRCRAKFKAGRNALIFRTSDLERSFVTHNAELLAMLGPQLDAELNARRARQTISDQAKAAVKGLLAGHRPSIRDVARQLNLSSRTLQRRLTQRGITFQRLLEEARRELACHYLAQSELELNQAAYLLGYEDPNSFFRAFHHWEGTSPGDWRKSHQPLKDEQPTSEGKGAPFITLHQPAQAV
jgi:AraC-like DNA-binding protein